MQHRSHLPGGKERECALVPCLQCYSFYLCAPQKRLSQQGAFCGMGTMFTPGEHHIHFLAYRKVLVNYEVFNALCYPNYTSSGASIRREVFIVQIFFLIMSNVWAEKGGG